MNSKNKSFVFIVDEVDKGKRIDLYLALKFPEKSRSYIQKLIKEKGVTIEFLTLNVGAGTFSPIRTNNIINHKMHEELYFLSEQIVDKIIKTKEKNGKIIACGTTTLRALEGNFNKYNKLVAGYHTTDLFIKYGFKFNVVDSLITNFHTPKSTLLILVCTFAGYENIFKYYNYAKNNNYKFFSYGDAMFII